MMKGENKKELKAKKPVLDDRLLHLVWLVDGLIVVFSL